MSNSRMQRLLLLLFTGIVAAALQARPADEKMAPPISSRNISTRLAPLKREPVLVEHGSKETPK